MNAASAAEVEGLMAALKKAKAEAVAKKAATKKVLAELEKVKTAGEKHGARVAKVQVELKDAVTKCEPLSKSKKRSPSSYPIWRRSSRR